MPFMNKTRRETTRELILEVSPQSATSAAEQSTEKAVEQSRSHREELTARSRPRTLTRIHSIKDREDLDPVVFFLKEQFLSSQNELDERLDKYQVTRARDKLLQVLEGADSIEGGTEEEMNRIIIYKGRPLRARLLHFAVWVSARLKESSCVERLLPFVSDEDLFAKAKHQTRPGSKDETWLDSIHIAAGLGAVGVMEVLLEHIVRKVGAKSQSQYVNTPCLVHHIPEQSNPWEEEYYIPLHDATNAGNIEVSMWLLDHGADARAKNKDGVTPLHFVALRGVVGGIESNEEVTRLVQTLCRRGASLESRIPMTHPDPLMRGKVPLELAAVDQSRFPKHVMHILAPCLNNKIGAEPRFFHDICFLLSLNTEAAEEVVKELVRRSLKHPELLNAFRLDAQQPGRTDSMASVLYISPSAAADMLDMLIVAPEVQDVSKHNIPPRTTFGGFLSSESLSCTYRPDVLVRDGVMLPCWKFDSQKDVKEQPGIQWHSKFMPEVSKVRSSRDVFNVSVSTTLLPNMLDIDIMMAVSQIEREDLAVFTKLSIKGIVHCLWSNLIESVWLCSLLLQLLELFIFIWWGLSGQTYMHHKDTSLTTVLWIIMAAGGIREVIQLGVLLVNWHKKKAGHDDQTMRSMWDWRSKLITAWCMPTLALALIQLGFTWGAKNAASLLPSASQEDLLLMVCCVLLKSWLCIYMLRLHTSGVRIHAISSSLLGSATKQMIVITLMIFASFSLAFVLVAKRKDHGWVMASAYRGLLFHDGNGLDNLGLNVHEDMYDKNDLLMMWVNFLGSTFFNIIVLNLIIAVYSNEYDRVQLETPQHFILARAKYCVMYYLSCSVFGWHGLEFQRSVRIASGVGVGLSLTLFLLLPSINYWLWALLLAISQATFISSLVQCDWFSMEGVAHSELQHFVWICHSSDSRDSSFDEGYSESLIEQREEKLAEVKMQMDKWSQGLERQMGEVDEKLDMIIKKVTTRLETMRQASLMSNFASQMFGLGK